MVATVFYLLRHAAHGDLGRRLTGRLDGVNLTPAGKRQAAALAERLADERLDLVQSSPRERTIETANAISARTDVPLQTVSALDEIDLGSWAGKTFKELAPDPLWQEWNANRGHARCPGGENMGEAVARIAGHIAGLAEQHPGARIALVSHADMLRGLIADLLGLPFNRMLRFEIAPASISRIEFGLAGGLVHSVNETGHLGHREDA